MFLSITYSWPLDTAINSFFIGTNKREELCKSLFEFRIYIDLKLESSTARLSNKHKLCVTTVQTSTADRPTTHPSTTRHQLDMTIVPTSTADSHIPYTNPL